MVSAVASCARPAAHVPAASVTPRRLNRRRNRSRARDKRERMVRFGQPNCRAASSLVRPSRWHRMNGARNLAGKRSSSPSSIWRTSAHATGSKSSVARIDCRAPIRSQWARRAACARSRSAIRHATRCNQPATDSRLPMAAACLTSAKKVAWKASSASSIRDTTRRQVCSTIAPCRHTSSSKAECSRFDRKRPQ